MTTISFASAVQANRVTQPHYQKAPLAFHTRGGNVYLVQDTDEWGGRAFYFLRVSEWQKRRFLRDAQSGTALDLSEYGEILHSAYGEPTSADFARASAEFGWVA